MLITIERRPGAPYEAVDEAELVKATGTTETDDERTDWIEYRFPGSDVLVHRSVHVTVKRVPDGLSAAVGRIGDRMANSQSVATSFKNELFLGAHQFGASTLTSRGSLTAPTKDTFKVALYLTSASLGAATTVYAASGEVSGTGYSAGGITVTNATDPAISGTMSYWNPSASFVFTTVTLSTLFDAALLYNSTQGNKAVGVFTFTPQTITAGTFTLTMPTQIDPALSVLRIG